MAVMAVTLIGWVALVAALWFVVLLWLFVMAAFVRAAREA